MVRIAEIQTGSIAEELELQIGSRIIRINGQVVRDGIDLTFLLADTELELETLTPSGDTIIYDISREPEDTLGIVPTPDKVRECANECVFCFIDGNPEGVRDALWLRDDDFRLSFTYGSYVTLTNLGPKGIQRLVDQRISPLFVSVHATEPEVRIRLLKNERAGLIMDQLRLFADHGLEVHSQVVLCPGWNDGDHLDRTMDDLYSVGPTVRSLSIVPVGLTKYNLNRPVRLLNPKEALCAIEQVDRARSRALPERGMGWCYAADEIFLLAGENIPPDSYYDDWALDENGVGTLRRFVDAFEGGLADVPSLPGRRIRIATGRSMAPFMRERAPLLAKATSAEIDVVEVANDFYGPSVTVAGLLGGEDIARALSGELSEDDLFLIPGEALNADELFIDSVSYEEVRRRLAPAEVVAGHELTATLRSL